MRLPAHGSPRDSSLTLCRFVEPVVHVLVEGGTAAVAAMLTGSLRCWKGEQRARAVTMISPGSLWEHVPGGRRPPTKSSGTIGDACDSALVESTIGAVKNDAIHDGSFRPFS